MAENTKQDNESSGLSEDEKTGLIYLARYDDWPGTIVFDDSGQQIETTMLGEILLAGRLDQDQHLIVERIERIALRSQPIEELGGPISIVGPTNEVDHVAGPIGVTETFDLLLYYPRLAQRSDFTENNMKYPDLEKINGTLTWDPFPQDDSGKPRVGLTLTLNKVKNNYYSNETNFTLRTPDSSWPLPFQPPSNEPYQPAKANSLAEYGNTEAATAGNTHPVRKLKVRFIAAPSVFGQPDLETHVQTWINEAGEVWCDKGGIVITPQGEIEKWAEAEGLLTPNEMLNRSDTNLDYIEIYLVENLTSETGGGATNRCGTNDAFVFLDVSVAKKKPYLLAHELGHVLGLYHPGECNSEATYRQGSLNSVMVPTPSISPRNTLNNLQVIEPKPRNVLTPHAFETDPSNRICSWKPDPHDPDPVFQDIWNSEMALYEFYDDTFTDAQLYSDETTQVFDANNKPKHFSHPQQSGAENYLCVRLWDCRRHGQPINIFFYLGAKQSVPNLWDLPGMNPTKSHLVFAASDVDEENPDWFAFRPKTRQVKWTVPNGPEDCWVFAVAVHTDTVPESIKTAIRNFINNSSDNTNDISTLIKSHPNVIGRKMTLPSST